MSVWTLDPAHSQIEFAVKHMMISTVRGQFRDFTATVDFDEEHPEHSTVEAHIAASSITTGQEARDAHLQSPDFFDAATYPELVFKSTSIDRRGDSYQIHGDLTVHGTTLPVVLESEIGGVVANLQGGRRAAFSATTRISRKEFGLSWNVALETGGFLVGDEIKISIELAALQAEVAPSRSAVGTAA
jgi:polyisoprenoid-binding protein YceI